MGWSKETILTSTEVAAFEFSLAPCRDSGICRVPGLSRRPSHTASSSSGKDIDLYWETVLGGEESGSEGGVGFMASRESCWAIHDEGAGTYEAAPRRGGPDGSLQKLYGEVFMAYLRGLLTSAPTVKGA